jgi:hypothetical protein
MAMLPLSEVTMVRRVQPKSLFGVVGSAVLGVTLVMTACGGDGDDDGGDDNGGGGTNSGGTSTAGNGSATATGGAGPTGGSASTSGGTNTGGTSTAGAPSGGGVAGRQQFLPNLRKNTAPSAN